MDLLPRLLDAPDDDALRLVYADALEEGGEPEKGEYLRLECAWRRDGGVLLHDWPQNVRELKATLEVARVRAGDGPVRREHLPDALSQLLRDRSFPAAPAGPLPPLELLVPRFRTPSRDELTLVVSRLRSVTEIADFFGKDRKQVYRWLERHALEVPTDD